MPDPNRPTVSLRTGDLTALSAALNLDTRRFTTEAARLLDRFAEMQENLRKAQQRAANAAATVADPTERVKLTVDQHGRIQRLDISPAAMGRMSAAELSSTIVTLVAEATAVLQAKLAEQFHTAWGTDLSPQDIMDGRVAMGDAIRQLRQANWGTAR